MTGIAVTLALGFCLAFAESGLGLGIVLPGETAVVVLAATMGTPAEMVMLGVAVMFGATAGDHVGYLLRRRGGLAVFATRLVPVVRTLTPAAAGAAALEYRRFAPASLAGSATWSAV